MYYEEYMGKNWGGSEQCHESAGYGTIDARDTSQGKSSGM